MTYSLLIPTHNRSNHLKKNLEFLRRVGFSQPLIIADSSDAEFYQKNKAVISAVENDIDIRYLRKPGVDQYIVKIMATEVMVQTPALMFCGDDDFIFPENVEKASKFLDENADYSIVSGRILTFRKITTTAGASSFVWSDYPQQELLDDDVITRVSSFIDSYRPTFYAVHRTENFYRNFGFSFLSHIGRSLSERLFCINDVAVGKARVLDDVLLIREKGITLQDEKGQRTWADEIGRSIKYTKENLNFCEYESMVIDSVKKACKTLDQDEVVLLKKKLNQNFETYYGKLNKKIDVELQRLEKKSSVRLRNALKEKFPFLRQLNLTLREMALLHKICPKDRRLIFDIRKTLKNER